VFPTFSHSQNPQKKNTEKMKKITQERKKLYAEVEEKVLRLSYPDHPLALAQPVSSCFSSIFLHFLYSQFILSHTLIVSQFVSQVESPLYQIFFMHAWKFWFPASSLWRKKNRKEKEKKNLDEKEKMMLWK
jgi:hypothetical protein